MQPSAERVQRTSQPGASVETDQGKRRQERIARGAAADLPVDQVDVGLGQFRPVVQRSRDQILNRLAGWRLHGFHSIGGNDRHGFQNGIIQTLRNRILDESLLQLKTGAGHGQVLIALGDFGLGAQDIHLWNAFQLQLLSGIVEGLLGESRRFFVDLRLLVGADQIPINIFDLRDGGDHLVFERDVGDLLVVAGDSQIAQVRAKPESGEKFLLETEAILSVQSRRQIGEDTVRGLAKRC